MELQEKNIPNEVQSNRKISIIILLMLVIITAGLVFILYFNNQGMNFDNLRVWDLIENKLMEMGKKSGGKVKNEVAGFENSAFITYKDQLVECDSHAIKFMNKQGAIIWEYPVKIYNPIIKVSGSYLVIADLGGRELYAVNGSFIDWEKKFDENIINVDVNSSGYVTVVREAKGLKASLTLYDRSGNEIFTKGASDNYILSAKVAPDNNSIVVNNLNTSGLSAVSNFEFLNVLGQTIAGVVPEGNQVYFTTNFIDKDSVLVSGDTGIACFGIDGTLEWNNDFYGRKVYSTGVLEGGYIAVAISGENKPGSLGKNKPELLIMDPKGEIKSKLYINSDVVNISTYSDIVAVNLGREVSFYNRKGKLLSTYSSRTDMKTVFFFSRLEAAIVTKQGVSIISTH